MPWRPDEAFRSTLSERADAVRAFRRSLAIACPHHHSPKGKPCWVLPDTDHGLCCARRMADAERLVAKR